MPVSPLGPRSPQKEAARTRLDSWKEIAEYLGRGERTAKRWEAERKLPVHHVPGGGHGSVYAYSTELDKWLLSERREESITARGDSERKAEPPAGIIPAREPPSQAPAPAKKRFGWIWRVLAFALALAAIALTSAYFVNLRTTNARTSSLLSLLSRAGLSRPAADPQKELAHELYLRGRFEWNKRTPDSLNRALDYFTQSIVRDPNNAQAYVGLADTYNLLREFSAMPENEALQRSLAASKTALKLDDSLAEAHRSLAFAEIWANWDFQTGEKEFLRSIELNPRDPITHLWFANSFASPEWYPVCLREIDRAQELDPSSYAILADKGLLLFHAGQAQKGLELVQQVENADPNFLSPHRYLASMYLTVGDYPNYFIESDKTADLTHDQVLKETAAAARAGFHRDGERGLFHDLYTAQRSFYLQRKFSATLLAQTCARMGKKQEALELLREDYAHHRALFLMIRENLDLQLLKGEPQFQELLRKLNCPSPASFANAHSPGV
jgi:hypothetical protein